MTPYYQDSAVTIYHGDCREIVPQLGRFDLLLTDPPYGIGYDRSAFKCGGTKSAGGAAFKSKHLNTDWDSQTPDEETISIVRNASRNQIIWGGNYFSLPPSRGWIFWDKMNDGKTFAAGALAWTSYNKSVRRIQYLWDGMLQGNMKDKEERLHPTQKPIPVIVFAIHFADDDPQTILDPFAGSGTTGRAAKDLGRKATLIEREEKYCEIAAKRMAQEIFAL